MNTASQPLQRHEITTMKNDPVITSRVLRSYRLMLEFYGMKLDSIDTGLLNRVMPETKYADRYHNLIREWLELYLVGCVSISPVFSSGL